MSDLAAGIREVAVTLPDGAVRRYPSGTTPGAIATDISKSLGKAALAARVDGRLADLSVPIDKDVALGIVTAKDEAEALGLIRHDCAHIMARAGGGAGRIAADGAVGEGDGHLPDSGCEVAHRSGLLWIRRLRHARFIGSRGSTAARPPVKPPPRPNLKTFARPAGICSTPRLTARKIAAINCPQEQYLP